ncbi:helix-turn-helix domain-containing protein [Amycolatopsis sp. NPDC004772]
MVGALDGDTDLFRALWNACRDVDARALLRRPAEPLTSSAPGAPSEASTAGNSVAPRLVFSSGVSNAPASVSPTTPIAPQLWDDPEIRSALRARDISAVYRYLRRHGHSQREIAARTGQALSEVSEILKGRAVASYDVLSHVADRLDIPRGYMGLAYEPSSPDELESPAGPRLALIDPKSPGRPHAFVSAFRGLVNSSGLSIDELVERTRLDRVTVRTVVEGSALPPMTEMLVIAEACGANPDAWRRQLLDAETAEAEYTRMALLPEPRRQRVLSALLERGVQRQFPAGGKLYTEGTSGGSVWLVVSGWVRSSTVSWQGHETDTSFTGARELVGLEAALGAAGYARTATALSTVVCRQIPVTSFTALLRATPDLGIFAAQQLVNQYQALSDQWVDAQRLDVSSRVAAHLLRLAALDPAFDEAADSATIPVPLAQDDIARAVGASRRSVARILAVLRDRGIISTGYRKLVIEKIATLRELAARA